MKGKRFKSKSKNTPSIMYLIIMLVFVSMFIFSLIKIIEWLKDNKARDKVIEEIQNTYFIDEGKEDIEKYSIDFKKLKEKNSETIAWIKINGTDIEYPVVKTNNNEYYLNHGFDKSENGAGWVFMDYRNIGDTTDDNMIIYGHNRRDGGMLGTLKNILTEEWQNNEENLTIPFVSEKIKKEYKVFSVYKIEKEDYYITTNFNTSEEFGSFIENIKSRSIKDFGVDVTKDDKILTISTCANNNNYRVVLHAKKIE